MNNLEPIKFWEYFDYISLGFIVVILVILISFHYRKYKSLRKTISETIAENKWSSIIFAVTMTVFFPLYYAFLWLWVGYAVKAPMVYFIILIISALCEIVFVWIPARGIGVGRTVHTVAATTVALAMIALPLVMLIFNTALKVVDYVSIYMFLSTSTLIGIILITRKLRRFTIHIEVIYCLLFLAMMSVIGHS